MKSKYQSREKWDDYQAIKQENERKRKESKVSVPTKDESIYEFKSFPKEGDAPTPADDKRECAYDPKFSTPVYEVDEREPDSTARIEMNVGVEDRNKLVVNDLCYSVTMSHEIDHALVIAVDRICLSWDVGSSRNVRFHYGQRNSTQFYSDIRALNKSFLFENGRWNGSLFNAVFTQVSGAAFNPLPSVSIEKFVFPEAKYVDGAECSIKALISGPDLKTYTLDEGSLKPFSVDAANDEHDNLGPMTEDARAERILALGSPRNDGFIELGARKFWIVETEAADDERG